MDVVLGCADKSCACGDTRSNPVGSVAVMVRARMAQGVLESNDALACIGSGKSIEMKATLSRLVRPVLDWRDTAVPHATKPFGDATGCGHGATGAVRASYAKSSRHPHRAWGTSVV